MPIRRFRLSIRRAAFALYRSLWDAADVVGDHALFAALAAVTLVVLTLVFVGGRDAVSALWGLGAVWLVFLVFVAVKFVWAWRHPDWHRDWEWVDYGPPPEDAWRMELRSFAPLRPRPLLEDVKPLLCRVVAPDGLLWESFRPSDPANWTSGPNLRFYPVDFKCPECSQPPPHIPAGQYEITWLKPWWGPLRRPLLRYTQTAPEREQALASGGQAL